MTVVDTSIQWQKSSFSGHQGPECLELAHLPSALALRESDAPDTVLHPSRAQLAALLRAVKSSAAAEAATPSRG